ncbi:MAG TPA: DNA repair protein RadA [Thermoanaerobaculaceae bacterium]|nr:DNA repair protein RadA [Thermoanaerobaculaceae bacterium]
MAREGVVFECTACGQRSQKWLGRCPACGGWNSFEPVPDQLRKADRDAAPRTAPVSLAEAELSDAARVTTGVAGFDRVLGGGLVPGSVVLLAGEPGVGKSTLLLQAAARKAASGAVLYVSAEESARQVALRAHRLGCVAPEVFLLAEPVVEAATERARQSRPALMVVDSVQAMMSERVPAVPGSVTQVREVASQLLDLAKRDGPPVVLVGHVTKEGLVAGPKSLEHLVDAVVEFSGGTGHPHRILRATKNRFGPTLELALFAMTDTGLEELVNPSAVLLSDRRPGAVGSAVAVVMEGTTPLLVEVQALVARSPLANPRRVAQGVDAGRLALLLAVLEKRAGVRLGDRDVYVNVVGGLEVDEPALDVGIAAAVMSSAAERPLADGLACFGEIGLLGEVRAVGRAPERLKEARSLGFSRCAVPASTKAADAAGMALVGLHDVAELARLLQMLDS